MPDAHREFRAGPALIAMNIGAAVLFALAGIVTYRDRGWTWVSIGMAIATLLGLVGVIERLVVRVQLDEDSLTVRTLRGERRYAKADIERLEEERGAAPALRLRSGTWLRLPAVDSGLGESVRTWLAD
jgi:hypothetical protein